MSGSLIGFAGASVLAVSWPVAIGLFVVGFVVAFVAVAVLMGRRAPAPSGLAAEPEVPVVPEGRAREAMAHTLEKEMAEAEPVPVEPAPDERVTRLRQAFESGRITEAAYEANLARLGVAAPVAAPPPKVETPARPPEDADARQKKVERLRTMVQEGRITRTVYEENLRKLGVEPEPEVVSAPSPPIPAAPVAAPSVDEKVARLRAAYEAGRISREAYRENLRRLGGTAEEREPEELPPAEAPVAQPPAAATVEDKVARLRSAFESGRITREAYEGNLRKLGVAPAPVVAPAAAAPPAGPSPEETAAKLLAAYRAGRLSRPLYEQNVRGLGLEPEADIAAAKPAPGPSLTPERRLEKLRAAFAGNRISREAYVANAKALGFDVRALGLEMKVESPVLAPPSDDRVERLHRAYREGRLSRELYERNVRGLGGEPLPPPAPISVSPPSDEERASRIRAAYEAGRISRETYERNLRAMGIAVGPVAAEPPPPPPPPPAEPSPTPAIPSPDDRALRLKAAFENGRITRQAYEENLRRLGVVESPPAPEPPGAVVNPPAPRTEFEERLDLLTRMFVEGKVSRAVYEGNLARLYEAVDPRLAQLRAARDEGRISRDVYDANVRRVLQERGHR